RRARPGRRGRVRGGRRAPCRARAGPVRRSAALTLAGRHERASADHLARLGPEILREGRFRGKTRLNNPSQGLTPLQLSLETSWRDAFVCFRSNRANTPRLFGTRFARLALPGKVTAFLAETAHGRAVRQLAPRT